MVVRKSGDDKEWDGLDGQQEVRELRRGTSSERVMGIIHCPRGDVVVVMVVVEAAADEGRAAEGLLLGGC